MNSIKFTIIVIIGLIGNISALAKVTILSPTNYMIMYVGETNMIKWIPREGNAATVSISLRDRTTSAIETIASRIPNIGNFEWVVGKRSTNTSFQIIIHDGSAGSGDTTVAVTIQNGPRPPAPVSVPVRILPVVSVEWETVPGHTYRLESSPDLRVWTTQVVLTATSTNAGSMFYKDITNRYFRVYDMTPNGP